MFYSIDNPKNFRFLIIIHLAIITVFSILLFERHNKTVKLERELARINHEVYLKQVIHENRVKKFEKEALEHEQQVQQMKSEILSKLKKNED